MPCPLSGPVLLLSNIAHKAHPADLASLGGAPLFDAPRHVNKPSAPARAAYDAYLSRAWDAGWFTNDGPLATELEARLASALEVPEAVLMASGTLAMDLLLEALGLRGPAARDQVILPAYTFTSTANLLRRAGLTPVFADIEPIRMTLCPQAVAAALTPQTGAVIATHSWGEPAETEALQKICDAAGVPLLFDAAHAFGVRHQNRMIGGFGRAEVFSLHATKLLHSFEGGLVTTHDTGLAADLRLRRNFGFSGWDRIDMAGVNAKMSEAHAAMGLANLDRLPQILAACRAVHKAYAAGLTGVPGVTLRQPGAGSNRHYVVAEVDTAALGLTRDQLMALLIAENVLARRYFSPGTHRLAPHAATPPLRLPVTEAVCDRVLLLPGGAALAPEDAAAIAALIGFIAEHAAKIAAPERTKAGEG